MQFQNDGIEYVSMVWGSASLQPNLASVVPNSAKYLLGFNEPNYYAQSNLPAEVAASLWPQVESVADSLNLKIVSPAVNYCGGGCTDTDPFVYLDKFFAACTNCRVDYIAVHWYSCTAAALSWYLNNLKQYGKQIWMTEIACGPWDPNWQDNDQFHIDYMTAAVQIMESDPDVFRYAWFSGRTTGVPHSSVFADATGQFTQLGLEYISQPCGGTAQAVQANDASYGTSDASNSPQVSPTVIGIAAGLGVAFVVIAVVIVVLWIGHRRQQPAETV